MDGKSITETIGDGIIGAAQAGWGAATAIGDKIRGIIGVSAPGNFMSNGRNYYQQLQDILGPGLRANTNPYMLGLAGAGGGGPVNITNNVEVTVNGEGKTNEDIGRVVAETLRQSQQSDALYYSMNSMASSNIRPTEEQIARATRA